MRIFRRIRNEMCILCHEKCTSFGEYKSVNGISFSVGLYDVTYSVDGENVQHRSSKQLNSKKVV